jgi:hypothetical protein
LLIMSHGRRQILWFGATAHPTAEWIANHLTEACGWEQIPRYLLRDRDGAYGEIFLRRVRSIGIRDPDGLLTSKNFSERRTNGMAERRRATIWSPDARADPFGNLGLLRGCCRSAHC